MIVGNYPQWKIATGSPQRALHGEKTEPDALVGQRYDFFQFHEYGERNARLRVRGLQEALHSPVRDNRPVKMFFIESDKVTTQVWLLQA